MKQYTLIFGVISIILITALHIFGYYDGLYFDASLVIPLLLALPLYITIIGFLYCAIVLIVSIIKKQTSYRWIGVPILLTAVYMSTYYLPIPRYVDGMAEAAKLKLDEDTLNSLAKAAIEQELNWRADSKDYEDKRDALLSNYPKLLSIQEYLPPNIRTDKDVVQIYFGSGIVGKHWGIVVTTTEINFNPKQRIQADNLKKVFERVWVFEKFY